MRFTWNVNHTKKSEHKKQRPNCDFLSLVHIIPHRSLAKAYKNTLATAKHFALFL